MIASESSGFIQSAVSRAAVSSGGRVSGRVLRTAGMRLPRALRLAPRIAILCRYLVRIFCDKQPFPTNCFHSGLPQVIYRLLAGGP